MTEYGDPALSSETGDESIKRGDRALSDAGHYRSKCRCKSSRSAKTDLRSESTELGRRLDRPPPAGSISEAACRLHGRHADSED
ncbi:hypothetical protein MPC1_80016 [Methylocella tundrae]|nr:hypothetical protein MPC1_80016 [Methylocella tundrae]